MVPMRAARYLALAPDWSNLKPQTFSLFQNALQDLRTNIGSIVPLAPFEVMRKASGMEARVALDVVVRREFVG